MSLRGRPLFSALSSGTATGGGSFAVDPVSVVIDVGPFAVVLDDEELDGSVSPDELISLSPDDSLEVSHNVDTLDAVPR